MSNTKKVAVDDQEPVLSVMIKPREAIRYAMNNKTFSYALYIGAFGGFASSLMSAIGTQIPIEYTLFDVVYASFVTGVIFYLTANVLIAAVLAKIGKFFKGRGTVKQLFQILCIASIPYIWLLPFLLFWMQLSPNTFFASDLTSWDVKQIILFFIGVFVSLVASIWVFVLTVVGVSEVQQISKRKAFLHIAITFIGVAFIFGVLYIMLLNL